MEDHIKQDLTTTKIGHIIVKIGLMGNMEDHITAKIGHFTTKIDHIILALSPMISVSQENTMEIRDLMVKVRIRQL